MTMRRQWVQAGLVGLGAWLVAVLGGVSGWSGQAAGAHALAPEYDRKRAGPEATLYDAGLMVITEAAPGTASHTGLIITLDGQPIPGATVTLTPSEGGRSITAVTDSDDRYAFVEIPASMGPGTTGSSWHPATATSACTATCSCPTMPTCPPSR